MLRTLVEAEIAARDESNARARLRAAGFPVEKTFEAFNASLSTIPAATLAYIESLEWIGGAENLCLIGPAGTGKWHVLLAAGHAAVAAGMRVRYFAAADLIESLYRGLADNSVARIIDQLLRAELVIVDELGFAPLDLAGSQLLFRFVAAAYERRSLGVASHFPFEAWGRFLPEHTTATSLLDRLVHHRGGGHRGRQLPHAGGQDQRRWSPAEKERLRLRTGPHLYPSAFSSRGSTRLSEAGSSTTRGGDFQLATSGDFELAIDTRC